MKAAKDQSRSAYLSPRKNSGLVLFQIMEEDPQALDRLDISFRWGRYGIQLLCCHLTSFPARTIVPAHKHREYEFHFIPAGKGSVTLNEGLFPLQAGMFYLTGPQVVHQQDADRWEAMYELCLHIDITSLEDDREPEEDWGEQWEVVEAEECIRQLNTMPSTPTLDQYDAMNWFLSAWSAWHDRELGAYTTIKQAIIQILQRAARAHHVTQIQPALPSRDMNAYRYQRATQYIRDNYAQPLTLEEVADTLHICGRQLQRILDEQGNETFSSYLEHYRLAQVCLALAQADHTVEQLAAAHGFSSGSYLHYVFKKRLGLTPLHYREQQRQKKSAEGANALLKTVL